MKAWWLHNKIWLVAFQSLLFLLANMFMDFNFYICAIWYAKRCMGIKSRMTVKHDLCDLWRRGNCIPLFKLEDWCLRGEGERERRKREISMSTQLKYEKGNRVIVIKSWGVCCSEGQVQQTIIQHRVLLGLYNKGTIDVP